jgi:uncharacterized protein YjbI with pentapeptide repeats
MIWERTLIRIVPPLIGIASIALAFLGTGAHSSVLGSIGLGIATLMGLAALLFEREVRRSEDRLRRTASDKAIDHRSLGPRTSADEAERRVAPLEWHSPSHGALTFDNVSVRDLTVGGAAMTEASFVGASLRHCDLSNAQLSRADFSTSLLIDDNFTAAILRSAVLDSIEARQCTFDFASCEASNWTEAFVEESDFHGVQLSGAQFTRARLEQCDLKDSNITNADFSYALLKNCSLESVLLADADFSQARIVACTLGDVDFSTSVLDRTSIETADEDHRSLISHLLRSYLSVNHPGRWMVFDASVAYIQVALEDDGQLRCEAVNFDSWPNLMKSRKMTQGMKGRLQELGFSIEPNLNYVSFIDSAATNSYDQAGELLADALESVYGVSAQAPLKVTASAFEDIDDPGDPTTS